MSRILGKKLIVELSGAGVLGEIVTLVGMSTNCALSISTDMEEVAGVGKQGRSYLPHRYEFTLDVDRLCTLDESEKSILFWTLGRTPLKFRLIRREGKELTDIISGNAYISSYSINAPVEGYASANLSLQGTGGIYFDSYGE